MGKDGIFIELTEKESQEFTEVCKLFGCELTEFGIKTVFSRIAFGLKIGKMAGIRK